MQVLMVKKSLCGLISIDLSYSDFWEDYSELLWSVWGLVWMRLLMSPTVSLKPDFSFGTKFVKSITSRFCSNGCWSIAPENLPLNFEDPPLKFVPSLGVEFIKFNFEDDTLGSTLLMLEFWLRIWWGSLSVTSGLMLRDGMSSWYWIDSCAFT